MIPNFVKIVRAVLEIVNIYIPTYTYTILARLIIRGNILKIMQVNFYNEFNILR